MLDAKATGKSLSQLHASDNEPSQGKSGSLCVGHNKSLDAAGGVFLDFID
jgi:hypothetical protein